MFTARQTGKFRSCVIENVQNSRRQLFANAAIAASRVAAKRGVIGEGEHGPW